ncbi:MAG: 3-oxoadipyl-CoA thiolase [Candidatus Tyrphobacter sp.]
MRAAFICDGVRTPIGRYGGVLASVRADDLAAIPIRALVERNTRVDWEALDDVYLGCANQAGEDNRNVARMASLLAGLSPRVPGSTVNRLCGSGMDAVAIVARAIVAGEIDLAIAGGVESMSRAPFVIPKSASAFAREQAIYDTTIGWRFVNPLLKAQYGIDSMPETAENVAAEFGVSREDQDAFALRSHRRTIAAIESGRMAQEIVGVPVTQRKERVVVERDEHPRADTSLQRLAALRTPFREHGSVTAGNASGVNDGAAAMIVACEAAVEKFALTPRARVVASATAGVEPRIMGMGPVAATRKLLSRTNERLDGFDLIELNEAFAAQSLAVLREFGLPDDAAWINPNGGAIALGHPLGMSGARLALTASVEVANGRAKRALCTMCIGVGQGIAMILAAP